MNAPAAMANSALFDHVREDAALSIVRKHMYWSMGFGLIPVPLLDVATTLGVQLKMLSNLADHYDIPFSSQLGKSLISSLIGGLGSTALSLRTVGPLMKMVPGVGSILGFLTTPALAGATTYAIGKVFIQHFESGGTFLNFDPETVHAHFQEEFNKAHDANKGKK